MFLVQPQTVRKLLHCRRAHAGFVMFRVTPNLAAASRDRKKPKVDLPQADLGTGTLMQGLCDILWDQAISGAIYDTVGGPTEMGLDLLC